MSTGELPLEYILRRSVTDGFVQRDDPELERLRHSGTTNTVRKGGSFGYDGGLDSETDSSDDANHSQKKLPLSRDPSIYYQKIGLASTTKHVSPNTKANAKAAAATVEGSYVFNTINNRRNSQTSRLSAGINGSLSSHYRPPPRGYGLTEYSTSEEEEEEEEEKDQDSFTDEDEYYFTTDSEDEASPVVPNRTAKSGALPGPVDRNKLELAHYVAHITGRMDPWDLKLQQLQEEGKEIAPRIAEKITQDFKQLDTNHSKTAGVYNISGDHQDIAQRLKAMTLETEAIKEQRKKEIDARNQAMTEQIEACLAQIKEERETAIRIREQALKEEKEAKERVAKEAEEKKKAEAAKKEAQVKAAADAAAAAAESAKRAAVAAAEKASAESSAIFVSEAAREEYGRYSQILEHIRTKVLPTVTNNPAIKKFCFGARRDIVASIGQLINKQEEVYRVATEINNYFKKTMSNSQDAYFWVLNCTAKKLVKQAETEALVKSAPTFPLAYVAVLLFMDHPQFLDVLMSRFAKKCPYVTPIYIQKGPNDTSDEFLAKLGYKKSGKGFESEAQYNARQCAMFTLYCAIMQTTPAVGRNIHSMSHAWTWMARILNMPPRPITPSLITVFLEVCGNSYLSNYRQQAHKVLRLLKNEFIAMVPKQGIDGTTRLLTLLEDYAKSGGQIPIAEGRNFDR
ncbi:hypothetical protein BX616_009234 [Lobosporangium transversale]|uniref:mRNA export factor GLE1 n=1 Tax=Lobosporangium transversale TaxID=64571 RepID=A0A1Y2GIJ0_9FUNG|nr:GLE1-like protein-domain-containing protein [Lobosporangium transversale]KAF9918337.1 hypothetical protein BX616_009234 [Lobosporangium transversale]ORZ12033.1 GLE1-like protein-domain-containing protein [Lobosporangium transversale]|eukprot:XP_021879898.1 GLE1-like protein-domain-containing protein [Lobosporangium transversale]